MNNKNKTILMLSIISMMLIPGGLIPIHAESGDLLLTINNPTPATSDHFGISVATTPTGDLLVGAYRDNTGAENAGSAYLFDGNNGSLLLTINNPTPERDDVFGYSVATTPTGDLLIGANSDDTGVSNIGSVYLFDGTDGSLLLTIHNPKPEKSDAFGSSVASTPAGDILVGAHLDDTGAENTGSVYLFDGTDGSLLLTINNPTPEKSDYFGYSISTTPTGDILVGALRDDTGATDTGSVYLFDGTDGSLLLTIHNPTPDSNDVFGSSVASTPTGDLLVDAYSDDTGAENTGSVYLFDGTDGSLLLTIHNPTPEIDDYFGYSISTTPTGDLLVGTGNAGSVYLFEDISSNTAPVIDPIPNQSIYENDSLVFLVNAFDTDPISFEISPSLNFTSFIDNGNNTATFLANPGLADSGVYSFNVTASDGINNIWQVFTLTVNNINTAPIITSLIADDPDNLDDVYSVGDTITITFDSNTNTPGGTIIQTRTSVNNLFTFTESLGQAYNGQWTAPDTFTITIKNTNNAKLVIGSTTVTPTGTTQILSSDGTSDASTATSPVLSGDFELAFPQINWIQLPLTDGTPLGIDCDGIEEYGRVMLDAQDNTLYLCTTSGWIAK